MVPAENGAAPRKLTGSFNGAIAQYAWTADGQSIVFGATTRARGAVYRLNVASGAVAPVAAGEWSGRVESVSADGRRGVAVVSTPTTPGEVNLIDIGGGDYQDLMSGVDTLIADGIADPDHLAIRGWSYGGILGGWTLTQTTRFKAASLGAMVADWSSEYAMGFNHDVRLWYIG